jgi:hypothetical protein
MVRLTPDTTTKTVLITEAAAGLSGTALFVLIHSLLIFPTICAGSGIALSAARRCLTPPEPT